MTTKTTTPPRAKTSTMPVWERLTVTQLADQAAGVEAGEELTASVSVDGIDTPLYVATTDQDGAVRVIDGRRRLAAAIAAGHESVPVTYRPVIHVSALTAHPGNVRKNLLIKPLRESLKAERRMNTPIEVTQSDTGLRVVDGHRRLAAALAEGWTHVPYAFENRTEGEQFLDMVTTASQRVGLSLSEEATALFAASELGVGVRRLAAASGRTQAEVKTVVRVGQSDAAKAAAGFTQDTTRPLSLQDLSAMVELEELDADAARRTLAAIEKNAAHGTPADYLIKEATRAARDRAAARKHRAELEATGARILLTAELGPNASPVRELRGVTLTGHATCQGDVWVLPSPDADAYTRYCTNTNLFGHTQAATGQPKKSAAERQAVISGNRHWDAATERRHEWLTGLLSPKKISRAAGDQFSAVVTGALINGVLLGTVRNSKETTLVARFTGAADGGPTALAAVAKTAPRAAAVTFAVLAAGQEVLMPRNTWRTDAQGEDKYAQDASRRRATKYLNWLVSLGYTLSPVEQAVTQGRTYDPCAEPQQADEDE